MRSKKLSPEFTFVLLTVAAIGFMAVGVAAQTQVLHSFGKKGSGDGQTPNAPLIVDASGNLYGTTQLGGAYDAGTVFELTPEAGGGWTETLLYSFGYLRPDGYSPTSGLIFDAAGNLYGTTFEGGAYGLGTVFELSPQEGGGWKEKILHHFNNNGVDGFQPPAGVIFDAAGNLYGATSYGGLYYTGYYDAGGTVFELTPEADGEWKEFILHSFGNGTDGQGPAAGVVLDAAGNLYGTTSSGGAFGQYTGTVFELERVGAGRWTEKILYNFRPPAGYEPTAPVVLDATGNLYGTTYSGGTGPCVGDDSSGCGTVFELSPQAGGTWKQTVVQNFDGVNGQFPSAGVILDSSGNLYGEALNGGSGGSGVVFALVPGTSGTWTDRVLHNFVGSDGFAPIEGLVFDNAGNLCGSTASGGAYQYGVVFEITP
jgi:uncharacterized repeat protein (TIGR03803 family)